MRCDNVSEKVKARVLDELEQLDMETLYDEMLDENGPIDIMGMKYCVSRVLSEIDPTAYKCGFNDFLDGQDVWEIDGEYYKEEEVQEIIDEEEEAE